MLPTVVTSSHAWLDPDACREEALFVRRQGARASAPRDGASHRPHAVPRAARTRPGRPNRDLSSTVNRHRQQAPSMRPHRPEEKGALPALSGAASRRPESGRRTSRIPRHSGAAPLAVDGEALESPVWALCWREKSSATRVALSSCLPLAVHSETAAESWTMTTLRRCRICGAIWPHPSHYWITEGGGVQDVWG